MCTGLPSNYQTPEQLAAYGKPLLHRSLQETAARSFGAVPFAGPEAIPVWSDFMNTYLLLQSYVDVQIGAVLADARLQAAGAGEHDRRVHLRPRRVRRRPRHARQGRIGVRGGDPGSALCVRPARDRHHPGRDAAHSADLERGRDRAAVEPRERFERLASGTRSPTSQDARTWPRSALRRAPRGARGCST